MHRYPMEEAPGALSENAEFYKRMALVMLACQMRNPSGPAFYRDQPIVRDHIAAERAPYFIDICLATHPPSGQVTDPVIQFGWDYYKNGDIIAQLRRECTDAVLTCEADAYESMNDFGDYTNDANKWYPLLVDYLTSTAFLVRLEMLNRYDGTAVIAIWHWRMKLYVIYRHVTASDVKKPLEVISILWTTICQSVPDPVDDTMKTAVREVHGCARLLQRSIVQHPIDVQTALRDGLAGGIFLSGLTCFMHAEHTASATCARTSTFHGTRSCRDAISDTYSPCRKCLWTTWWDIVRILRIVLSQPLSSLMVFATRLA